MPYLLGLFGLLMLTALGPLLWLLVGARLLIAWIFISLGAIPPTSSALYFYLRASGYE